MKKVLVLGATGGMGYSIVNELITKGFKVIAFSRSIDKLQRLFGHEPNVTIFQGDVFDAPSLNLASQGVDVIFHAINIPYNEWEEKQPELMKNILEVAKQNKTKLAIVDNIYAYGRSNDGKTTELSIKSPHTKKGKIRLQLEAQAFRSSVPVFFAHFPDYYGPNAENTMMHVTLQNVINNKRAIFVGKKNISREYIFTPDGAKAIVALASKAEAYGQNWNIPACGTISGDELIQIIREETGYKKRVSQITKGMIILIGIFNPQMRELVEMMYLTEKPVILSGKKYEQTLGAAPRTSYEQGIKDTLTFMKEQSSRK